MERGGTEGIEMINWLPMRSALGPTVKRVQRTYHAPMITGYGLLALEPAVGCMPIRTGRAFLDSLRDDRQIWIDGERVTDVATDRRFAAAAHSMAELYDMQHDPALLERMTYRFTRQRRARRPVVHPAALDR